jgi:hypothetical protein
MDVEDTGTRVKFLLHDKDASGDPAATRQAVAPWRALVSTPVQRVADHLGAVLRERLELDAREEADHQFLLGCRELFAADAALRAGTGQIQ